MNKESVLTTQNYRISRRYKVSVQVKHSTQERHVHTRAREDRPRRKGGYPAKYRPWMCDTVIRVMGQGYSKMAAAAAIGVARGTFYRWCDKHPDFCEAVKIGEAKSQYWWEERARQMVLSGREDSWKVVVYVMCTRFGWRW